MNVATAIETATSVSPLTSINTALCTVAIGILTLILRHQIASRKVAIEEEQSDREGWKELIESLREEVSGLRSENIQLRNEIRELHGIIDGMRRENQAAHISTQRVARDRLEGKG